MVKAYQLRSKTKKELEDELTKMKEELGQLRVAQATGGQTQKLSNMCVCRLFLSVVCGKNRAAMGGGSGCTAPAS
jgi:ribosomal protein L29